MLTKKIIFNKKVYNNIFKVKLVKYTTTRFSFKSVNRANKYINNFYIINIKYNKNFIYNVRLIFTRLT